MSTVTIAGSRGASGVDASSPGQSGTDGFAPVEIDGRLLGDGGLAVNATFEPILDEAEGTNDPVFILDLFARDGRRPTGLESALARKNALVFGNQTWGRLEAYRRYWDRLPSSSRPPVFYLSYFPVKGEAGPEMPYDFSLSSAQNRWSAGRLDMEEGLARLQSARGSSEFVTVIRRRDSEGEQAQAIALQKAAA